LRREYVETAGVLAAVQ